MVNLKSALYHQQWDLLNWNSIWWINSTIYLILDVSIYHYYMKHLGVSYNGNMKYKGDMIQYDNGGMIQ